MNSKSRIQEKLGSTILAWNDVGPRRMYFSVRKEDIRLVAGFLFREMGFRFSIASGVDTPEGIEILYHFCDDKTGEIFSVRVLIEDKASPTIDSIAPLFAGAEWIEREMWELLGVNFTGHPNLKRLLLDEDWPEGRYPLRKE